MSVPVLSTARWVVRHRAWSWWHLVRYWRFLRLKVRHRGVETRGLVFLDRGVEISATGLGRLVLGRWVHVGAGSALRCHEGTLTVGDNTVFAHRCSVNCYLDVEIGADSLIADDVFLSDFDHNFAEPARPIREQGIAKSRVRVEPDVWLGTKVAVTRGVVIGQGSVVGANAVVTRDIPSYSVAAGVPARVIRGRRVVR